MKKCRSCYTILEDEASFCSQCASTIFIPVEETPNSKKQNEGRKIAFRGIVIIAIFVGILLVVCSPKAKTEAEIKADIKNYFLSEYSFLNFDNIKVIIEKRQTDKGQKVDDVGLHIDAETDLVNLKCDYQIVYALYNDGWKLEKCDRTTFDYDIIKSTITEELAKEYLSNSFDKSKYDDLWLNERNTNLYVGTDTFIFRGKYSEGYVTLYDEIIVKFNYSLHNGWGYESIERNEIKQEWSITGRWSYNSSSCNMWINILDISEDTITIEYDFDYTCAYENLSGLQMKKAHYKSDGCETRTIDITEQGIQFNLLKDEPATPYVYVSSYGGLTFDGVWFNEDDTFVFYYDDGDGYQTRIENELWPETTYLSSHAMLEYVNGFSHTELSDHDNNKHFAYGYKSKSSESGSITFNLYGQYKTLSGICFLNKYANFGDKGEIKIWGNGELLYSVQASTFTEENHSEKIAIDITDVYELTIEFSGDTAYYKINHWGTLKEPVIAIEVTEITK